LELKYIYTVELVLNRENGRIIECFRYALQGPLVISAHGTKGKTKPFLKSSR